MQLLTDSDANQRRVHIDSVDHILGGVEAGVGNDHQKPESINQHGNESRGDV